MMLVMRRGSIHQLPYIDVPCCAPVYGHSCNHRGFCIAKTRLQDCSSLGEEQDHSNWSMTFGEEQGKEKRGTAQKSQQ